MTKLLKLVRVALRVNFGLSLWRPKYLLRSKRDWWLVPVVVLGLAGVGPMIWLLLKLIRFAYGILASLGQQQALLTFAVLAGQFLVLLFGFYYVISAFYFSRDLELLIPLPLSPAQVMISKFAVILSNEYLTVAILVVPIFVSYGVLSKARPVYWLEALIVYLLLPVAPLAVASLLVVVLMRFVNLSRRKDAFIIVGSLVLIAAALFVQVGLGRSAEAAPSAEAVQKFLSSPDGLVQRIGAKFPPSIWASKGLGYGLAAPGPLNMLIFAAVSLALFGLLVVAAEKLFYRGVIGLGETAARRRAMSGEALSRRVFSGRRPVRAIFGREVRLMNRTPIFLLNGVLTVFLLPAIFVLMWNVDKSGSNLSSIITTAQSSNPWTAALAAALFMTICGCLNGTSSSTFSREGGQFWLSKVIPVAPRDQVKGKLLHSYVIAVLGLVIASAVLFFAFKLKALVVAAALGMALVAALLLTVLGMLIDLARPLLKWTNPQKAIKQNFNVLIGFFADIAVFAALFFVIRMLNKAGVKGGAMAAVIFAFVTVLAAASYWALLAFADKRYPQIET